MDKDLFRKDPRSFALELVDNGFVSAESLLTAALMYMSTDEVRDMLDSNELSPRFSEDDEDELTDEEVEDALDDFNYVGSRHHY
jgi:hypothetical protein